MLMKTALFALLGVAMLTGCEVYDERPVHRHHAYVGRRDYDDRYYDDRPSYNRRRSYYDDDPAISVRVAPPQRSRRVIVY